MEYQKGLILKTTCEMIQGPVELPMFSTSFFSIPSSHFSSSYILQLPPPPRALSPKFFLEEKAAGEKERKKKDSLTAILLQGDTTACCNTLMPEANVCETNSSFRCTPYRNSAPTELSPLMSLYVFFFLLW